MNISEEKFREILERVWLRAKCHDKPETMPETDYKAIILNEELSSIRDKDMVFAVYGDVQQSKVVVDGEELIEKKEESVEDSKEEKEDGKDN